MQSPSAVRVDHLTSPAATVQQAAPPVWSSQVTTALLLSCEMVGLSGVGLLVVAELNRQGPPVDGAWIATVVATIAVTTLAAVAGGSTLASMRRLGGCVWLLIGVVILGMVVFAGGLMLQGLSTDKVLTWSATWAAAVGVALVATRTLLAAIVTWLDTSARLATKIAILGDGPVATRLAETLQSEDTMLLTVAGRYSIDPMTANDLPAQGDFSTLLLDCRLGAVDAVVMTTPPVDPAVRAGLDLALQSYAVDIYMLPEHADLADKTARPTALGRQPMILAVERPLKHWRQLAKTCFDRLSAAIILAMIAPVLCVVAVVIRLDSAGPILFRQLRVGYNNRLFHIYKFRTMHAHATDLHATTQTTKGDARVTRVGRVLRKYSIDELPQLVNVLLGSMSLVGPRPHAMGTSAEGRRVDLLIDNYARRHVVKPGITGLAQVRGYRGGMSTVEQVSHRVRCDIEYIDRQSVWFDIKILVMTVVREFSGKAF